MPGALIRAENGRAGNTRQQHGHTRYDEQGRLDTVIQAERTVTMAYDDNGYLAAVMSDDGTTTLTRDAMGRIDAAMRPDNSATSFAWDPLGNLTGLTAPGKTVAYEMTNDVRGNQLTRTTPSGLQTTYAFDRDYRFVGMTDPVGRSTSVDYDASNRVDRVELDGEAVDYQYDESGQLAAVVVGEVDLDYTWDGPLPTSLTHTGVASGNVSWAWEDATLNLLFTNINGVAIAHDFDTDGMPTIIGKQDLTYQAGTTFLAERSVETAKTTYAYNDYGEVAETVSTVFGAELLRRTFSYDGLGRIVEVAETTPDGTTTYAYEYDLIGQLVGVEATGTQTYSHTYSYDPNGNRTAVTNGFDTLTAGDIDHDADDRLLAYGAVTFEYDDAGRMSRRTEGVGVTAYDYGVSGELRSVALPTGENVEYEHDALRRRVARKVDGAYTHRWLYADRLNPVAEVDANGETVSTFVYGTGINVPDYMERGTATYYFVRDHLGSVRSVVDAATGDVAQELRYDVYGNVLFDSNPGFQPFGYAGGLYDHQTGLVRFGARDYDARTGRWTAPDPIGFDGGQANLYVYVGNRPMGEADPAGLFRAKEKAGAAFFLTILAAGTNGIANAESVPDRSWSDGFWVGARKGWIGAVPGVGWYYSGKWTAEGNIQACLADPDDPDRYVEEAQVNSAVGAIAASAVGMAVAGLPGFLVGGAMGGGGGLGAQILDQRVSDVATSIGNRPSDGLQIQKKYQQLHDATSGAYRGDPSAVH